jgi:hypothetical protein
VTAHAVEHNVETKLGVDVNAVLILITNKTRVRESSGVYE